MGGGMMKKVMQTSSARAFVPSTISADGKHLHGPSKEIPPFSPSPFSLIYYMKEITLTCLPRSLFTNVFTTLCMENP